MGMVRPLVRGALTIVMGVLVTIYEISRKVTATTMAPQAATPLGRAIKFADAWF